MLESYEDNAKEKKGKASVTDFMLETRCSYCLQSLHVQQQGSPSKSCRYWVRPHGLLHTDSGGSLSFTLNHGRSVCTHRHVWHFNIQQVQQLNSFVFLVYHSCIKHKKWNRYAQKCVLLLFVPTVQKQMEFRGSLATVAKVVDVTPFLDPGQKNNVWLTYMIINNFK